MAFDRDHNLTSRDGPPDEAALLAWIEGEALSVEDQRAVAALLARDPEQARLLSAMRADRDALRALSPERAPAGMIDRVGSQLAPMLERRALLEGPAPTVGVKPGLRLVHPPRRTGWRTLLVESRGRRVAAIAAALLLAGAGVYLATVMIGTSTSMPPVIADSRPPAGPVGAAGEPGAAVALSAPAERPAEAPASTMMVAQAAEPAGAADAEGDGESAGPPWLGGLRPSEAAGLARQGQLVLRVRTHGEGASGVSALAGGDDAWALSPETPLESIALLSPEEFAEVMGPPAPGRDALVSARSSVYVVRARPDEQTLATLRGALERRLPAGEASFERAPERMSVPPEGERVEWAAVPVVIERRR